MTDIKFDKEISASISRDNITMKHIKQIPLSERQQFLDSFDFVFCDCDGVMWKTMHDVIPGAAEAINYLQNDQGKRVTFVTNNSITSVVDQLKKFGNCHLQIDQSAIIYPAQTVVDYLQSISFDGSIFCIASSMFKQLLRSNGYHVVDSRDHIIDESVHQLRSAIYSDDPVKAVVIDIDFNLTAAKLMRAHVHLRDPKCLFIAGAADSLIPFGGGDVIGPGLFISVLEQSTKRKATILGKPGRQLKDLLRKRFQLSDPRRVLFIGDSLTSDIQFGKMCGFQTLLVLSGGTKSSELLDKSLDNTIIPDYVANSLADLNKLVTSEHH